MTDNLSSKNAPDGPQSQNIFDGKGLCIATACIAFLLAATAYMWLPLVLGENRGLEQRIIKLEKEAHHPQDLSPLIKRISDLEQKQASQTSSGHLSREAEEIYTLLTLERKFEVGQPFEKELKLLEQLSGSPFSAHLHEMASLGIPNFVVLSQGFIRLARREVEKKDTQNPEHTRPWIAMVQSWVEKLVTIEPLNHIPKAYEPILKSLRDNDLAAAVEALNARPHEHFNIWLAHAKGRLDATKELEAYRKKRFEALSTTQLPVTPELDDKSDDKSIALPKMDH